MTHKMRKPYWRRGEYRTIDNTLLLPQFLYHIFIIFRLRNLSKLMCWSLYLIGCFTLDRKWRHLVNTNLKYMKPLQFFSKSNSFTMHPITRLKNTLLMPILDSLCQIDYILVYINSLKNSTYLKRTQNLEILEIDQYTTLEASICVANRSDFENVIA